MSQNSIFEEFKIVGEYTNQYIHQFKDILKVNATVLITGETGTGKELVARWIHFNDERRKGKPFVKITIPNIGENIFESEVFGYEKGAFTGAATSKKGLIEVAEAGTVFFDEIENATPAIQSKLLQLLEDRIYRKVGDTAYQRTEARFVIATNKDLYEEVVNNSFRADLYYRLAVIEIRLPPLRERQNDILDIANFYIHQFSEEMGKEVSLLVERDLPPLVAYDWPGNVRELKNFIEKAVIFSKEGILDFSLLPSTKAGEPESCKSLGYKEYMKEREIELLKKALSLCEGNIEKTASLIGMSVPFVYKKVKEYKF